MGQFHYWWGLKRGAVKHTRPQNISLMESHKSVMDFSIPLPAVMLPCSASQWNYRLCLFSLVCVACCIAPRTICWCGELYNLPFDTPVQAVVCRPQTRCTASWVYSSCQWGCKAKPLSRKPARSSQHPWWLCRSSPGMACWTSVGTSGRQSHSASPEDRTEDGHLNTQFITWLR